MEPKLYFTREPKLYNIREAKLYYVREPKLYLSNTNFDFILSLYFILVFQRHILFPPLLFCRGPSPSSFLKKQSTGSQILGPSVLTPTWR